MGRRRAAPGARTGVHSAPVSGAPIDPDALAELIEAVAVLLDAGIPPPAAWRYAGEEAEHPVLTRVATAVGAGERPGDALVTAANRSGDDGVRSLAAVWLVAEEAGAPIGRALRGAAEVLRDRAETARDIAASLAGPRATARLTGWMPLIGIAMALGMGIDVFGALVGSAIGWALLAGGAALMLAGRAWNRRLVLRAAAGGPAPGLEHDLMMVALAGGAAVPVATALVARARARVGLQPGDAATVQRVLRVAERAGTPAGELLLAAARRERRAARSAGRAAASALAVRLLLPLGTCVLPAFLLLGVAPVILALLSSTVAGLR